MSNLTAKEKESKRNKSKGKEMKWQATPGKKKKLNSVSDSRGIIAALACDQRQALRSLFGKIMGVDPGIVPGERLAEFKEAVSGILTPHASGILLDPEYGLPAAQKRAKTAGLLLAYEKTGYDTTIPERMPRLVEQWSVRRLVEAGADCVKLLLYYSTASTPEINERKHAFVERVGAECAAADVPFFLELVSYVEGLDAKGPEFAAQKPEVVTGGMREFSRERYHVDVLKVGVPVNLAYVEGSPCFAGKILYQRQEITNHYRRASGATHLPFIYLSEGVSNEAFRFGLDLAEEAQVKYSGVLCGRATWKDGVEVLVKRGPRALEDWLATEGVRNIQSLNKCLHGAVPWFGRGAEPSPAEDQKCFSV